MASEPRRDEASVASAAGDGASDGEASPRFSRRQAIGRMSVVATAGVVAWVAPEILTAKPADGAVLSGAVTEPGVVAQLPASPSTASSDGPSEAAALANALAFTGLNLERDAAVGVALVAGGWAMHHWASRPGPAPASGPPPEAGAPGAAPE
jgi:hypothetical protein